MSHGPEHHLEHAEHAHHASLDPFDRRVAMTMAIIAAGLACVTMLSHRAHNETLRLQSEANTLHTQASDGWNFYQAKNIRSHEFQAFLMSDMLARKESESLPAAERVRTYWIGQVDKYEGEGYWSQFVAYLDKKSRERPKRKSDGELTDLEKKARALVDQAHEKEHASHEVHKNANWLDYGHLCIELALVLASVAVLTKQKGFWFLGIAVAILGGGLALYAVFGMYVTH